MVSLKYDIPLLNQDTRFSLWQVRMQAILTYAEWDDALDGFGGTMVKIRATLYDKGSH
jgi:hypothetical protein